MSNSDPQPPPEPSDPSARRRETMLGYHLDALENPDEIALIRGRLESDPDWQRASAEAQAILKNLREAGEADVSVPQGLGERTVQHLRTPVPSPSRGRAERRGKPDQANASRQPSSFVLSTRMAAAIFGLCALPGLWLAGRYVTAKPEPVSLYWNAESKLVAGEAFAPNLIVRDTQTKLPLEGVRVTAYLRTPNTDQPIGQGLTNAAGVVAGESWRLPDGAAGQGTLTIEARSAGNAVLDRLEHQVQLVRSTRLALAPDRTQARPGETIRARALLVSGAQQKPIADEPAVIELLDPTGNRIGRAERRSTRFGLAWAEFPLDGEAPEGVYTLRAEARGEKTQQTVKVQQYRLPPFRVSVEPGRSWFESSEFIFGKVAARTFDGQPVANAKGELRVLDLNGKVLRRVEIVLEAEGSKAFEMPPPAAGDAPFTVRPIRLEVQLTDPAGRSAEGQVTVNLSSYSVVLSAVAEAGELVQGLENRVYLIARKPDGSPLRTTLHVTRVVGAVKELVAPVPIATDEHGVGVFTLSEPKLPAEVLLFSLEDAKYPLSISVPVRPIALDSSMARATSSGGKLCGRLLMRTDKAVLLAGQTLNVEVFSGSTDGSVVLALRQDGRTIAATGVTLRDGKGTTPLLIPDGASGLLTLDATQSLPNGQTWSDRRSIAVSGAQQLRLVAHADRENAKYRPGEKARLEFQLSGSDGKGLPGAVSVVAVDQALLAMTGEHPGLAQALQAAGVSVFRTPGFPLDPGAFGPEEGLKDAARAALAAVHRQEDGNSDREDAQILDTSSTKLAAHAAWVQDAQKNLGQWPFGLLAIALVLLILRESMSRPYDASRADARATAIPLITMMVAVLGILDVLFIGSIGKTLLLILAGSALASHVMLLASTWNDYEDSFAFHVATIITDGVLALLLVGALTTERESNLSAYLFFLGFGSAFAAAFQYAFAIKTVPGSGNAWLTASVCALGLFLLVGLVLPMFAYKREHARRSDFKSAKDWKEEKSGPVATAAKVARAPSELTEKLSLPVPQDLSSSGTATFPRLRWDFPETLIFAPQIVTDEQGRASLEVPLADSLTEWRVQADAIGAAGGTAWSQCSLIATQPFSVDLTLPTDVTAGDLLSVPAVVSNHTDEDREVEVNLTVSGALAQDGVQRTLKVSKRSVAAAKFVLRFEKAGAANLRVTATASHTAHPQGEGAESDAVERTLNVLPDGEPVGFSASALVHETGSLDVQTPDDPLPDSIRTRLTLHRGPLTQMLAGLESMLREPNGCFEQTSSTNYPNVMVLRYLKANNVKLPAVEQAAQGYLARGYQRLLGFEIGGRSGSFSLYGQAPASPWLTAYGLLQFQDMDAVQPVDPALLERIRTWLKDQMRPDGSFALDSYSGHEAAPLGLAGTAYVVWALGPQAPPASVDFLRKNLVELEKSAYLCALSANALMPHDRATAAHLAGKLRDLAQIQKRDGRDSAQLASSQTIAWGHGNAAAVEASALGVLALLESGQDMDLAKMLLAFLQENVTPGGGWGSTHATVLALKALERAAATSSGKAGPMRVVVELNGNPLAPITLPAEETATPVAIPLNLPAGMTHLRVQVSGGPVAVHVTGQAFVPWGSGSQPKSEPRPLRAELSYDAKTITKGQAVLGTLSLTSSIRGAEVPMAEWGLPAGMVPESEGLDALKAKGTIKRWERSGRRLRLYLPDLSSAQTVTLPVRFFATAQGELKSASGCVYEYYRRQEALPIAPVRFEVR